MSETKKSRGGYRPGGGRPKVDDSDKKRTRSIMLTDSEYEKLCALAKERGLTRSALVLSWIMNEFK